MRFFWKLLSYLLVAGFATTVGFLVGRKVDLPKSTQQDSVINKIIERPLEKYAIENLSQAKIEKAEFRIGEQIAEIKPTLTTLGFTSHTYSQTIDPDLDGKATTKVTGVINLPTKSSLSPVILMLRGYVDPGIYSPGVGTRRGAEEFAKNGFITIAPDFLGYADSDENAADVLESRFQTYTTALATLFSIDTLPAWDKKNVFIWGHSNGGHIALTLLEITGAEFPTVLWAPVSKPFPYSVLYYTDESADQGKFLRKEIADFEALYDASKYSLGSYWSRIKAPIQLHQGTADSAVPLSWSNTLHAVFKQNDIESEYFTYPGGDHNLTPGWDSAVERSLEFFKSKINQ